MYITHADELAAFCERATASKVLAIDTEFLREKTYHPKLCLIQAATPDESAIIDPILIDDLSPLAELFANQGITKVFHACTQDLEVIQDAMGVIPVPIFDTQVAAAFLGMRVQIGYGPLVEETCGVRLPKAEALSDWSARPLEPEQLAYAEDDVRYLPQIYELMMRRLVASDHLGWVLPEMEALGQKSLHERDPRTAYLHLRRVSALTRKQLAVAREACAWRERTAAARDLPRRWVLSDEVLVECCRKIPRDVAGFKRIRGAEQLSAKDARDLLAALRRGAAATTGDLPRFKRRERPSAETEGVIDLMYALVRIVSQQSGVAAQLLATRDDLMDYLQHRDSPLAHGWRHELLGERLDALLQGRCGLTVKDGRVEVL